MSASFIGLMETGQRPASRKFIERAGTALKLEPAAVEELIRLSEQGSAVPTEPNKKVSRLLRNACKALHASSSTFYVQDSFWPNEWRLVATHGVKYLEPMYGFVSPKGTWRVLQQGSDFCSDTTESTERRDTLIKLPNTIKPEQRVLFSDFVGREKVISSARLKIEDGGIVKALLFVNFSQRTDFTDNLKKQLFDLRDALEREVSADKAKILDEDVPILKEAVSLLRPMQDWVAQIGRQQQPLVKYLESVLDDVLSALQIETDKGYGTIHLYRSESDDLVLMAHRGAPIDEDKKDKRIQSVIRGEGIISWVALRQRALVIEDLHSSLFQPIHIPLRKGIVSALAVPMMVGDLLAGVLNLETEERGKFTAQHARALWYAAGSAGVAARLHHEAKTIANRADMSAELLRWFCMSLTGRMSRERTLNEFAEIARQALDANVCDMWGINPRQPVSFARLGATYPLKEMVLPRPKGMSEYVCRNQCAILITNNPESNSIETSFWNDQLRTWDRTPPRTGAPESGNPKVPSEDYAFEFGLPIVHETECLGVVWLKFKSKERLRPTLEEMMLAQQFAQGVGSVLNSLPVPQDSTAQ